MKKIIASLLLAVLILFIFGCAQGDDTAVNVAVLKGPTAIGAVKLMEDNANGSTDNKYNFTTAGANDEIVAALSNGDVDIAAIATNLASSLYKKTEGKIKVVAVNTLGVLYIIEKGQTINDVADLRGKTIYSSGQGAVPEYALNYILETNGLEVGKDVFVEYKTEHSELATLAASGSIDVCMLPEPFVSTVLGKNSELRSAIDITEAYAEANAINGKSGELAMGCIVARADWAEKNPDKLDAFLKEYKSSTEYASAAGNLDAAADLCVKYGIIADKNLAKSAIPNCNIVYKDGDAMKTTLNEFFSVLYDANPASIGGQLPDENFYYKK